MKFADATIFHFRRKDMYTNVLVSVATFPRENQKNEPIIVRSTENWPWNAETKLFQQNQNSRVIKGRKSGKQKHIYSLDGSFQ